MATNLQRIQWLERDVAALKAQMAAIDQRVAAIEANFSSDCHSEEITMGQRYWIRRRLMGLTGGTGGGGGGDSLLTDNLFHAEPALPSMGAAGTKITDPTFGTQILRLTDATDGNTDAGVAYSYLDAFNSDCTKVYAVQIDGFSKAKIWTFNPTTFAASAGAYLSHSASGLQEYWLVWSHTDPAIVYGLGNNNLYSINVNTGVTTTLKDFTADCFSGGSIQQLSVSHDDDIFAFNVFNSGGVGKGYLAWKRSTNAVRKKNITMTDNVINEVQLDRTGRWLVVIRDDGVNEVWDLQPGTPTGTTLTGSDAVFHRECGTGTILSNFPTGIHKRNLSAPTVSVATLISDANWPYTGNRQDHFSHRADNELWMMNSRYRSGGEAAAIAYDNELMQLATDGSGRVRRICHHRSTGTSYEAQPKATISRNGRFCAFTSDWDGTLASGRRDVFIVEIPAAPTS